MDEEKSLLLKIRGLRIEGQADEKWFEIVHGIDLDLHRGEVMGLIGESGAGKSTIGLAAMGFTRDGCRISAGAIEFDGMELTSSPEEDLRMLRGARIAYVAQSAAASFNPVHKLIDQHTAAPVQHKIRTRRESEADAMDLYRRLRLPNPEEIGFRYPHQVSGGQLQRAMTAMAMSCRPDLIIFDEPTTALDVTTQIEVLAAIRDIVDQFNTAALYITHDLAVVAQMADRIKVLLKGDEIEEADTRSMLSSPREDYTKSLWAVRSFWPLRARRSVGVDRQGPPTVAVVGESGSPRSRARYGTTAKPCRRASSKDQHDYQMAIRSHRADRRPHQGEEAGGRAPRPDQGRVLPPRSRPKRPTPAPALVAEGILKLLDRLQEDLNLAYMFITHDLATVRSIADEVVVMKEGKVVEAGPKDEMFRPPHHEYTDLLLSSVPEMDPDWLDGLLERRGVDNIGEAARNV